MLSFYQFSRGALIAVALAATAGAADAASMKDGVKSYKPFVVEHIGKAIAGAKEMQSAVKAGNLEAAQKAWIASRKGWEAMEPVTGTYFGKKINETIVAGGCQLSRYYELKQVFN